MMGYLCFRLSPLSVAHGCVPSAGEVRLACFQITFGVSSPRSVKTGDVSFDVGVLHCDLIGKSF